MRNKNFLIFLCLIFATSYAYAAKVTPVRFDVSIAPGASKEFVLNITGSKGEYNQNLMIYASDLFMNRNGALSFTRRESRISAVNWIKTETEEISLMEDQSKQIKFKISVPLGAKPGEYYAVVMVDPKEFTKVKDKDRALALQMKTRVAVVIILDVPGRIYQKDGEIVEVKVNGTDSLVSVISTFKNLGNIHLDVVGEGVIRSADGRMNYGKFLFKAPGSSQKEAFVFPDAMRDFEGVLERPLPKGEYLVDVSFDFGYEFKKAKQSTKFSIERELSIDEDENEFLALVSKELKLQIPEGGRRTEIIKITNTDYRPIKVDVVSDAWVKFSPNNLILKPGEVRNVMATISVPSYEGNEKESTVTLKTDRGMDSQIKILAFKEKEKEN